MPIDIRLDQSLPAFTNCSLDDDPGAAAKLKTQRKDPYDGDPTGQVNLYLFWQTEDIFDTPDSWEITVALTAAAPKDQCTVDITPRRLQNFKPRPPKTYKWTNTSNGKVIQQGKVVADKWGLVTIPKVIVGKKNNRIVVSN